MCTPNVLLAGAARSGTTVVARLLERHPDVSVCAPKEPHFLAWSRDPDLEFTGPGDDVMVNRDRVRSATAYARLFEHAENRRLRVDASVSTLYRSEAVLTVWNEYVELDAKVVVVLREPASRAQSAWSYLRSRGHERLEDFGEALAAEDERMAAGWHHLWHYRAMGDYAAQLAPFVHALDPANLCVLFHEDLAADPQRFVADLQQFLGLTDLPRGLDRANVSGAPRNDAAEALIRLGERPRVRAAVRAVVPRRLRDLARRATLQTADRQPATDRLHVEFAEANRALRDLLGRPLPETWAS